MTDLVKNMVENKISFTSIKENLCNLFGINAKTPLVDAMKEYKKDPMIGFHIPGHNRGAGVHPKMIELIGTQALSLDCTDEFDNLGTLHPATGAIAKAQELAAQTYGAKRTFFITSGSTSANLALAFALTSPFDEVLIGRNCHRSVLTGLIISGAKVNWLIPKKLKDWSIFGNIEAELIEEKLKNNRNIKLVWITNPTYEGVVSDIKKISEVCKKYKVSLIVDEAHGSLWNYNSKLPTSALQLGADAVVHSLHKTGGAMTQASMLHLSKNSKFDEEKVIHALKLLHTTSPSLLLLASLDAARANLSSPSGQKMLNNAIENALYFRAEAEKIENLTVLKNDINYDLTKIFIKMKCLTGLQLEKILEEDYRIEVESASDAGLLILSNIGNTRSEFEYLVKCLKEISGKKYDVTKENIKIMPLIDPEIVMNLREAYFAPKESIDKFEAIGRISSEVVALCPPGISILLPGEIIKKEHLPYLFSYDKIEVIIE
ncbi:MAG: aminotransferase class I/II-fold pyridoxal phosphate-dependent enzyme [Candidatus Gastranaerophilales bacterium]|nr:aminotransferase class I/II-fold pyridoxal phosphate-dependent enzyme [Candidatus Gastranaerophilales bacterium]